MTDVPRLGPPVRRCGGCEGLGAHTRWCPVSVGDLASRYGRWSEQAEDLADLVGSNNPAAANHLYAAAGALLDDAKKWRRRFQGSPPEGV